MHIKKTRFKREISKMSEEAKIENLQFETAREETRLPKIDEEEM